MDTLPELFIQEHLSHRHPNHLYPGHRQLGDHVQVVANELYSVRLSTQRLQYRGSHLFPNWMASCGNSAQVRATDFRPSQSSIHLLGCLGEVLDVTLRRRSKTRSLNSSDSHTARVTGAFSPSKLISPQTQQHRTMQSSQNLLIITLPPFGRRRVGWGITFKEVHHNFLYRSIKGVILYWILFPLGDSIPTAIS